MRVELVDPQGQIMGEIEDPRMTRDDVALSYAFCLKQAGDVDFAAINRAIMGRWSLSALKYVKEKAWRYCQEAPRA